MINVFSDGVKYVAFVKKVEALRGAQTAPTSAKRAKVYSEVYVFQTLDQLKNWIKDSSKHNYSDIFEVKKLNPKVQVTIDLDA